MKTMTAEKDENLKPSEEYIIRLLQTIGSLDFTIKSMRDELARLREKDAANDLER